MHSTLYHLERKQYFIIQQIQQLDRAVIKPTRHYIDHGCLYDRDHLSWQRLKLVDQSTLDHIIQHKRRPMPQHELIQVGYRVHHPIKVTI